jgi:signal transduction histidine kinase
MHPRAALVQQGARMMSRITDFVDRRPLLVDLIAAGAVGAVSLVLVSGPQPPEMRPFDTLGLALTCAMVLLITARRRAPLGIFAGYATLWFGYVAAGYWPVVNSPGGMLAFYTVASSRSTRAAATAAMLFGAVWIYAGSRSGQTAMLIAIAQSIGWIGVIWRVGYTARQLTERNRQLALFTVELGREQEHRAQRAVIDERMRIARELHDVVAHHMSVVSVQAGLAKFVLERDPATARAALRTVLHTSGEALQEMRRMLSLLDTGTGEDDEPGAFDPAPGLDRLDDLVERVRAAGVPVEVTVSGDRHPLAPGVDLCAYRVLQECLTNVIKHAPGAHTTVRLRYDPDRLTIQVGNGAIDVTSGAPHTDPGGHGLAGMRERARLYGGALTAGPRPQGGFEVVLVLPTPVEMGPPQTGPPA